jgi:BMFP domain-containing protein YqiC
MNPLNILQDMQQKIESMLQNSPAKDVQSYLKSLMNNTFSKLDLVTREEFEIQKQVLQHTRAKLDLIEKQLDELLNHDNPHHNNINNTAVNLHSSQHDAVSFQKEEV